MEKFETPPYSPPITVVDPNDQPMWSSTRTVAPTPSSAIVQIPIPNNFFIKDDPTQGILDTEGIFLYNTPNEAFKILEDKVLLKLDFSKNSQNPKPKTVISAGGSNINPDNAILMEKFKALATKIDSEFLKIRKELKEMRDGRRDNHASQIYMSDDTPNPHPSQYFKIPKTSTGDMMKEWMDRKMEADERMKDQVVELGLQIDQGLRNRQAIIENLERQFEYLEKIKPIESIPRTTNTKPRHEPPSIRNENNKGNVKVIEEYETETIPTMPKPSLIKSNSPTVSPFLKDCTVHIPYTNAKTFADAILPNHVGDKELKSVDGVGIRVLTKNKIKKDDMGMPKEPNKEWKLNEKAGPQNEEVYHYQWHPTEIPHLDRIIKES
ncbi:hypothetical protein Tco_0299924 [Tanacetum coccineum]